MNVKYSNDEVELQCTSLKAATKLFGGNKTLATSLLARINAIKGADVIKDIILTRPFRFHNLHDDLEGFFAVDVKTKRDKWRIILQPLDENEQPYDPCHIDKIAAIVKIVEIMEVSPHYE